MLRTSLAIGAGKTVAGLTHLLKLGAGTSLPGKIARRVDPQVLHHLGSQVRRQVMAVTGTNGKTTTCGLLAQFLREADYQVVHNTLGANMVPGITAALIRQSTLTGHLNSDYAVLEVDEASLKGLTREMTVQRVVVTNLFRDQLDRYGELDTTARLIRQGIDQSTILQGQGRLVLNGDDPLVTTLGRELVPERLRFFGVGTVTYQHGLEPQCPVPFPREVTQCPVCQESLAYSTLIFGHLGHYCCGSCGYTRPQPGVAAEHVLVKPDASEIRLRYGNQIVHLSFPLPGLFNVYNLLAAAAVAHDLGLPVEMIARGLQHYQSVFGRAEKKVIEGRQCLVMLIKNPVGASEVLKLVGRDPKGRLLIGLNDNYADGRDVSWIWDAQFEMIPPDKRVIVTGQRAEDMAVRLKYAGLPGHQLQVIPDLKAALHQALSETAPDETLYVLPTYTVLLDLNRMAL